MSDAPFLEPEVVHAFLGSVLRLSRPGAEVLTWDAPATALLGYRPGEVIERPIFDLLAGAERAHEARRQLQRSVEAGSATFETAFRRKDATLVPVTLCFKTVRLADGEEVLVANIRDASEVAYLRQIKLLAAKYGSLLEAVPDATVMVNGDGRIVLVNGHAERLFGYAREEILGQPVEALIPDHYRGRHPHDRSVYFLDPRPRPMGQGRDLEGRRKDGSVFPAEISLAPLETEEGTFATAAIRDVTIRKRAESKFRGVLESAPDAMVIVDSSGRIVLANAQTERLFGYAREEILGQPVEIFVPDRFRGSHPHRRQGFFREPRVRGMGAEMELFGRRKDGTEFPVEISLAPLETEEGVLVSSAIRDLTERRRLEELRHRSLEEANRLKSEFLANMSHELRTPLNAIIGFTELVVDQRVGPLNDQQREFLSDVLASSRHLLRLINDVLDLSKIEAGKMVFLPEAVSLSEIAHEVRSILQTLAASKRIHLGVEASPEADSAVLDPGKLKQVLYNFLSNALKFTPEGGRITVRIRPHDERHFELEVEDTGIGIQESDLPRLFVEFQQLDDGAAKKFQGTGLGLALTKRIVEAQGGRVGVRSTKGVGSVFSAVLPFDTRALWVTGAAGAAGAEAAPAAAVSPGGAPTVLVVDDDVLDRTLLVQILSDAGFRATMAGSGKQAVTLCRQQVFAAIVLDLLLPDTTGLEVLREVRTDSLNLEVPVVVVTVVAENVATGFPIQGVLTKPVDPRALISALVRAGAVPWRPDQPPEGEDG